MNPEPCACSGGEPAPEKITDKIYGETQKVSVLKMADIPDVDLSKVRVRVRVRKSVRKACECGKCDFGRMRSVNAQDGRHPPDVEGVRKE